MYTDCIFIVINRHSSVSSPTDINTTPGIGRVLTAKAERRMKERLMQEVSACIGIHKCVAVYILQSCDCFVLISLTVLVLFYMQNNQEQYHPLLLELC